MAKRGRQRRQQPRNDLIQNVLNGITQLTRVRLDKCLLIGGGGDVRCQATQRANLVRNGILRSRTRGRDLVGRYFTAAWFSERAGRCGQQFQIRCRVGAE
jgi:hypothetical protein